MYHLGRPIVTESIISETWLSQDILHSPIIYPSVLKTFSSDFGIFRFIFQTICGALTLMYCSWVINAVRRLSIREDSLPLITGISNNPFAPMLIFIDCHHSGCRRRVLMGVDPMTAFVRMWLGELLMWEGLGMTEAMILLGWFFHGVSFELDYIEQARVQLSQRMKRSRWFVLFILS